MALTNEGLSGNIDLGKASEEFDEDFHTFARRENCLDRGGETEEGSLADADLVTLAEGSFDGQYLALAVEFPESGDGFGVGGRVDVAKMDNATDTVGLGNVAMIFWEVEAGEDVAREEGLDKPDDTAAGFLAETDARANHLDPELGTNVGRGDVLVFGLTTHAEPWERLIRLPYSIRRSGTTCKSAFHPGLGSEIVSGGKEHEKQNGKEGSPAQC